MGCPHGFPKISQCVDCMEDEGLGADPVPPLTVVATFTSQFASRANCAGCNLPIVEGVRIARMSDDSYRHAGCTS